MRRTTSVTKPPRPRLMATVSSGGREISGKIQNVMRKQTPLPNPVS